MAVYTLENEKDSEEKLTNMFAPPENTAVYFVGDSRTEHMINSLQNRQDWAFPDKPLLVPDKVNVIAKSGQGLGWLYWEGLTKLKEALAVNKGKNHAVNMNLGVNDAAGVGGYEIYDNADYNVE